MKPIRIAIVGLSLGLGISSAHAYPFSNMFGGGNNRHEAAMQGQKGPKAPWQKDLLKLRSDAERGKLRFGDVFAAKKLFANIASGREQQLGFDSESGARS